MKRFQKLLLFNCLLFFIIVDGFGQEDMGNLQIEGIPEIPTKLVQQLRQYNNTRGAFFVDWTPSGESMLIKTRFGETSQFHILETPLGARQQITFFDEPVSGGNFHPTRTKFIFRKDIGGDENYQLFYFDVNSGKNQLMTDGKSRNRGGIWNHQGNKFAYSSTKRNDKDYDIYLGDEFSRSNSLMIFQDEGFWYASDWAANDEFLLIGKYVSANESYIEILDVDEGFTKKVRESDEAKISYRNAIWSKDDEGIFMTSDYNSEYRRLKYYDLETRKFKTLTPNIDWNIGGVVLSENGEKLAFTSNEDGVDQLYILNTSSMNFDRVPGLPAGLISNLNWNPDNKQLAFTFNTPTSPSDVYVLDITSYRAKPWTKSEVGGLNTDMFVEPTRFNYESFDKKEIPAIYYKPNDIGPHPVLIYIHGGPESQYRPSFSPTIQYYVNELGLAVIAPNVRGSNGFGKTYLQLDNGFKREDSVKDIGALLDWVDRQPELDGSRVGVIGGSYGGYMVLASMIEYNDRLQCGVDIVGISNFVTFLKNTKSYRRDLRRQEYGDEQDPDMEAFLQKISPSNNADKIKKPLFIVQGLNDPRVPASEAEQMLAAIRSNGNEAWYLLAKDEGHGFKKKKNRDYYTQAVMLFLDKFLVNVPAPEK